MSDEKNPTEDKDTSSVTPSRPVGKRQFSGKAEGSVAASSVSITPEVVTSRKNPFAAVIDNSLRNDPWINVSKLRGADIYASAATGKFGEYENPKSLQEVQNAYSGAVLEGFSVASTKDWEIRAKLAGLPATVKYYKDGVHNWPYWNNDLASQRGRVLNVLGAW